MSRFLLTSALALSIFAADPHQDRLIQQLEQHYNEAHTLSLEFSEQYQVQGHARPPESGTLSLRKQGKMRWDYSQPAGKLFISDGKTVYLYTAGENRVEKVPVRDTEDMRAPLAFLLGHLDLKKEFRDFRAHPGEGGTWLDASSKSSRTPYEQVSMLVKPDGSVRNLKILGRDGSAMELAFTNEKMNPPLEEKLFRFAIPPGAEVVDAVEFGAEGK